MASVKTKEISKKDIKTYDTLAEIAKGREDIYRFFSGFYLEIPTKSTLKKIADDNFIDSMTTMFGKRATAPLQKFAKEYKPGFFDDIRQEFTELFVIPMEGAYLTPYESVYMTGLMLQRPLLDVKSMHRRAGAEFKVTGVGNHEDYIGCELGFMHFLTEKESAAWKAHDREKAVNYLKYQVNFLEEHLTLWIDELCARMEEHGTDIYQGLARCTARFVDLDYEQAANLLEAFEDEE